MGITVVGDDDQSIYSFRGAQPEVFKTFCAHMGDVSTVTLRQNYRSSGTIVSASAALIRQTTRRVDKAVFTEAAAGAQIELCECRNVACEADWVVERLRELKDEGVRLSDGAILYRTHKVGRDIWQVLRDQRVPTAASSADVFACVPHSRSVLPCRRIRHPDPPSAQAPIPPARCPRPP